MNEIEIILLIFSALMFVAVMVALTGRDLAQFEQMRSIDTKSFHRMKSSLKFNGPMVALLCGSLLIGLPIAMLTGDLSPTFAFVAFADAAAMLWLSIRWTQWAYR